MHLFFEYITAQLAEKLVRRRVVVWYDRRREFGGYLRELRGGGEVQGCVLERVKIGNVSAQLCCCAGSLFEVKYVVDPVMAGDEPEPLLVYLPGMAREDESNVLLELDRAGM